MLNKNNQHKEFPLNSSRKLFSTQTFSSNYISCFKSDLMNKIIFSFSTLKTKFFNDLVFWLFFWIFAKQFTQIFRQSSVLSFHIKHKIFAKLFSTKFKNRKVFQVNFRFKNRTEVDFEANFQAITYNVPALGEVANFGTTYFLLKIKFLAKCKLEFTTKFAILPNAC